MIFLIPEAVCHFVESQSSDLFYEKKWYFFTSLST